MTLIKMSNRNRTLRGHKLLLADPRALPDGALERIHSSFPDLQVQKLNDKTGENPWHDATISLAASPLLPSASQAPNLELVQLTSAGADGLVGKPLFDDTDISFCTASGVHGYNLKISN